MATFDEAMRKVADEEGPIVAHFRQLRREVFEDFYPKLTDAEIETALELCAYFGDLEVRIIQSFYRTTCYLETVKELQLPPGSPQGKVRHTILQAFKQLPEDCPLRTALQMAYDHRNIRRKPFA